MAACDKSAQEEAQKADQAQREANDKAGAARREADDTVARAQKEADEKAAQANSQAAREIAKEQAKANDGIREANHELVKARNDFQVTVQKKANDLDAKIDDVKVKATKEPSSKAKSDFDAAMRDVEARRAALDSDLRAIGSQSVQTFDSYKAKVDKEIDELKKSIDTAKGKL
jgi:hypothetical protein